MKRFIDITKAAERYKAQYICCEHGAYSVHAPKLGKKGVWLAVENGQLKASESVLRAGAGNNKWLDELAADFANGRVTEQDLI